jgi:hypothetical protein
MVTLFATARALTEVKGCRTTVRAGADDTAVAVEQAGDEGAEEEAVRRQEEPHQKLPVIQAGGRLEVVAATASVRFRRWLDAQP